MAVRRFDSGTGDFITLSVGDLVGFNSGAFTVAALARKESDGGFLTLVSGETTGASRRSFWTTDANILMTNTGGFNINTPVSFVQADGWSVVAVTKPAGVALTRGHKGVLGGAWTHTDGDEGFDDVNVIDQVLLGSFQGSIFWDGLLAVVGIWKRELSDAELEDGLRTSLTSWLDAAPNGLWALNQESVATPLTDLTGNGADQMAIDGTSVEAADDPPGFTFATAVVGTGTGYGGVSSLATTARSAPGVTSGVIGGRGNATPVRVATGVTSGPVGVSGAAITLRRGLTVTTGIGTVGATVITATTRSVTARARLGGLGRGITRRITQGHTTAYGGVVVTRTSVIELPAVPAFRTATVPRDIRVVTVEAP